MTIFEKLTAEIVRAWRDPPPPPGMNRVKSTHLVKNQRKPTLLELPSPKRKSKGTNTLLQNTVQVHYGTS